VTHFLLTVIADGTPHNHGPDFGKASPLGLLVVVLLVIATVFLVRSMNKQLRKVPKSFDRNNPEPDQAADEGTDAVDGQIPGAERDEHG
jgi:hypothetical protein